MSNLPIKNIVIHCSASYPHQNWGVREIDKMHRSRGFRKIGYHYVIKLDGNVEFGRSVEEIGAHVQGSNSHSIGICYIGGYNKGGEIVDTRTEEQKKSLINVLEMLVQKHKGTLKSIKGHRDYSPDLDGDGIIERNEWMKGCPCFDVIPEYAYLLE